MADILIKPEEYNAELAEIDKGFLEKKSLKYDDTPDTNFPSMLAILGQVIKMDEALKNYDAFLKNDVAECVKIGENFVEIDAAYSNAVTGGE